jgi:hypothetical protein
MANATQQQKARPPKPSFSLAAAQQMQMKQKQRQTIAHVKVLSWPHSDVVWSYISGQSQTVPLSKGD